MSYDALCLSRVPAGSRNIPEAALHGSEPHPLKPIGGFLLCMLLFRELAPHTDFLVTSKMSPRSRASLALAE